MASKSGKKKKRPTAGKTSRASSSGAKRKPAVSGKPARKREAASSRGTGRTGRPVKQTSPLTREIVSILFIGLAILLFLSVYINGAGAAEAFLKRFIVGLFGVGGYLLPFALAGFSVYGLISKPKRPGGMRRSAVSFAFLFLFVISAAHVINWQASASSLSFTQYIQALYVDGRVSNGGLIGGVFGNFLTAVFQKAGSVVILAVGILAMAVIFTGQSIVGAFRAIASSIRSVSRNSGDEGDEEDFEGEETDMRDERERGAQGLDIAAPGKKPRAGALEVGGARQAASGGRDEKKLMLFQEEVVKRKSENPLFGSRRIERDENWQGNVKKGGKKPYIDINKRERAVPEPDDETAPDAGREIKLSGLVEADKAAAGRDLYEDEDEESAYTRDIDDFEPDGEADAADVAVKPESGRAVRRVELFPARETAHRANAEAKREPEPELRFQPPQPEYQPQPAKARRQAAEIPENISTCEDEKYADYKLPPLNLMKKSEATATLGSRAEILENSRKLEETLASFRVEAKVVEVSVGPTVTRYEMAPGQGVKVSSIANLSNDLALSLAAQGIRIEAPIPGKSAVGIEIPNKERQTVFLRDILEDEAFQKFPSKLAFAVGKDIGGNTIVVDVDKMPHLLIAGATGSGKSVCINTLIASILYKARPDEVKFIMVDPKVVELNMYNGIPHLLIPVVTDPKKAAGALNWAVIEMDRRYNLFAENNVRDLKGYNAMRQEEGEPQEPQIVIIIDELADLMMLSKGEVEETICRLAQKARAAGLHLIVATQRPSVDVITGLIKANIPSRLAFAVSSGTDSRTVLDMTGAEKLLGKGDMLFLPVGRNKPMRIQCGNITDRENENLVEYLKSQVPIVYDDEMIEQVTDPQNVFGGEGDTDEFFDEAVDFLIQKGKASASVLQRQFRIGYNRASRLIEELEARGIVGPEDGSKPRKVLIKRSEWENRG